MSQPACSRRSVLLNELAASGQSARNPYNESNVGTYFVQNFGCRATQADGAALETLLAAKGLEAAGERSAAGLGVLNTCTVTSAADDKLRQTIRPVHRETPAAQILVTGCSAQRAPEELACMPGVEWVIGNSHKTQIADLVTTETRRNPLHIIGSAGTPYHGNIHEIGRAH